MIRRTSIEMEYTPLLKQAFVDRQTDRHIQKHTQRERETGTQTDRQTDRQTGTYNHKERGRQAHTLTYTHTHTHSLPCIVTCQERERETEYWAYTYTSRNKKGINKAKMHLNFLPSYAFTCMCTHFFHSSQAHAHNYHIWCDESRGKTHSNAQRAT